MNSINSYKIGDVAISVLSCATRQARADGGKSPLITIEAEENKYFRLNVEWYDEDKNYQRELTVYISKECENS